jgi:hypothetical protein
MGSSMTVPVDYLDDAVDRVLAMLLLVSATFTTQVKRVEKHAAPDIPPPCWWVYPGAMNPTVESATHEKQVYDVMMRLILGKVGEGYDAGGILHDELWVIIPTVQNYFRMRPALVYEAGQSVPKYLHVPDTNIRLARGFGRFNNSDHVGIEFQLQLGFRLALIRYPGN